MPKMIRFFLGFIAAVFPAACYGEPASKPLIISHVTVIDVQSGARIADQNVVVIRDHIFKIGPATRRTKRNATVIDARGKFLIPGLWDMHVHTLWNADRAALFFPLFLANGVTGVREMGGPMLAAEQVRWRERVASGDVLGPRLIVSGPFVDGPHPIWPGSIAVASEQDGKEAVDSLKSAGVDFVKAYSGVPRPAYFAIATESRKDGIPFVGHVPLEIGADEASDAGQKSIEHLMGILLYSSSQSEVLKADLMKGENINQLNQQMVDTYDPRRASTLFALFVKNRTWQVPTLTVRHARPYLQELQAAYDPRLKYMPKDIIESWSSKGDKRQPATPELINSRKHLFQKELALVAPMHQAGVEFLAGTDTPNLYCYPGFSLPDELGFMVQAGLTPLEALQTATLNPARFLGLIQSLGTIQPGKIADLVLLDADPLENIANTKPIAAVISAGRYFDRPALNRLLDGVSTKVAGAPTQ